MATKCEECDGRIQGLDSVSPQENKTKVESKAEPMIMTSGPLEIFHLFESWGLGELEL